MLVLVLELVLILGAVFNLGRRLEYSSIAIGALPVVEALFGMPVIFVSLVLVLVLLFIL